jgi:hypothetical protein
MSVQSTKNNAAAQQPFDKAIGLLAGCVMVMFGGWMGLPPATILIRTIVVSCVSTMLAKMAINMVTSSHMADED